MKLILLGGIQGVGKTTLLSWLHKALPGQFVTLNAGEMFRRYAYGKKKVKTAPEVEERIVKKLLALPRNAIAVIHWHYAVRRPNDTYIPQISFARLARIARSGKITYAALVLLDAHPRSIRARRKKDHAAKNRPLSLVVIDREAKREQEFFAKTYAVFARGLGTHFVATLRLRNTRLALAKKRLEKFFKVLLGS